MAQGLAHFDRRLSMGRGSVLAAILATTLPALALGADGRPVPVGVRIDPKVMRSGVSGDNWCMTWAADDSVLASMDDGFGWTKSSAFEKDFHNTRIYRITGGPDAETFRAEPLAGAPDYGNASRPKTVDANGKVHWDWIDPETNRKVTAANWYAYGTVSIDGHLYQFLSHCAERQSWGWFDGCQLVHRPKGEERWQRWNGSDAGDEARWIAGKGGNQLFIRNEPGYAFSFVTIAQYGRDYRENTDGYVYLYAPNGTKSPHELNMARVKKDSLLDRAKYEYFVRRTPDGGAEWAAGDPGKRGVVHAFPEGWGWYSWSPSVVWNRDLKLFVMATGGSQKPGTGDPMDRFMHYETGSLKLLWSERPWGPWHEFHDDETWDGDDPGNRLYLPQLSPKWIEDGGRTMYLIYSDARDRHKTNYRWNMQKITLKLGGE